MTVGRKAMRSEASRRCLTGNCQVRRLFPSLQKKPRFFGEYDTSRLFVCWWYTRCTQFDLQECWLLLMGGWPADGPDLGVGHPSAWVVAPVQSGAGDAIARMPAKPKQPQQ
ncbi:hypothetical protein ACIQ9Q_19430 [Streptomyces sp. NPDC094438]|uniref:hypothetical protein n=1 Tax=Streptomyces sp. NPDC094438 TaxID=3366061 RepID=UPI00380AE7C2